MKKLPALLLSLLFFAAVLPLGPAVAWAKPGKGKGKPAKGAYVYYAPPHVEVIAAHCGRPAPLPPGLAKKLYRTGALPPGWEKKLRPFPQAVVQVLPPPCGGCVAGMIGNYAVVYDAKTRIILDVLDIVAVAAGAR